MQIFEKCFYLERKRRILVVSSDASAVQSAKYCRNDVLLPSRGGGRSHYDSCTGAGSSPMNLPACAVAISLMISMMNSVKDCIIVRRRDGINQQQICT